MAPLAPTPPPMTSPRGLPGARRRPALLGEKPQTRAHAIDDHVDHRRLERRREVSFVGVARLLAEPQKLLAHRRLEPGQREIRVRAPDHRTRQVEATRVAVGRQFLDRRSARIGQTEHFADLVESLAGGVVDGRAETLIGADAAHRDKLRMAARDDEREIGKVDSVGQPRRQRMGFEMIDRDERLARRHRQRLAGREPDQYAADQPRPRRRRDGVDAGDVGPRVPERAQDQPVEHLDMGPGGDLRHDAAVSGVAGDLAHHLIGENFAAVEAEPPSTIATAVSSQVVSMPRTRMQVLLRGRVKP